MRSLTTLRMAPYVLWSAIPKLTRHSLVAALLLAGIILTAKADNPTSNELQNKSGESETFRVENEQAAMRAAVEQARKTVGQFIKALQHRAAGQTDFEVKKPFVEGNDVEHIWLSDIEFSGGRFKGKVDNAPMKIHGLKIGQVVSVNPDEISDWAYVDNGKLVGGITTTITDGTISTATTSAFIIFTAVDFTAADFMVVVGTGRDELPEREEEEKSHAKTQRRKGSEHADQV